MHFNVALAAGTSRPADTQRQTWLPTLLNILQGGAEQRGLVGVGADIDSVSRRRPSEEDGAGLAPGVSEQRNAVDTITDSERKMLPGSRSLRREQLRDQLRETVHEQRQAFRQALRGATQRGRGEMTQSTPRSTGENMPKTSPQEPMSRPKAPDASAARAPEADAPRGATGTQPQLVGASRPTAGFLAAIAHAKDRASAAGLRPAQAAPKLVVDGSGAAKAATAVRPAGPASAARGPVVAPVSSRGTAAGVKPAAARAGAAERSEAGNPDANIERILRMVRTRLGKDRSVATLRLDPPELGTVRLRMDLRHEQLSLQIETQSGRARRLLGDQLDALRRGLQAAGIQLERVELRVLEAAPGVAEDPGSQHTDVGSGEQGTSARTDDGSAGGSEDPGTDATLSEPGVDATRGAGPESATESLVNILA